MALRQPRKSSGEGVAAASAPSSAAVTAPVHYRGSDLTVLKIETSKGFR
jgi:hypothetical protein